MFGASNMNVPDHSMQDINVEPFDKNPTDTVSCISWLPNNNVKMFGCSSWDSKIRIYELSTQFKQCLQEKSQYPCPDVPLSICFKSDSSMLFCGLGDNTVKVFDIQTSNMIAIGQHEGPVSGVHWVNELNVLISTSFDKNVYFWQLGQPNPVAVLNLDYKIFTSDFNYPLLLLGLSNEKLLIIDVTNMSYPQNKPTGVFDNPLGSPVSCLSLFQENDGVAIGTYDGRANLSKISRDSTGIKTSASGASNQILLPVHAIGCNPRCKKFVFTAGADGTTNFWDYDTRNKIKVYNYTNPVTRAKISPDGMVLAYSLGYDWHMGVWGWDTNKYKSKICAHVIQDTELLSSGNNK